MTDSSETPRTDMYYQHSHSWRETKEFAHKLERALRAAQEELSALKAKIEAAGEEMPGDEGNELILLLAQLVDRADKSIAGVPSIYFKCGNMITRLRSHAEALAVQRDIAYTVVGEQKAELIKQGWSLKQAEAEIAALCCAGVDRFEDEDIQAKAAGFRASCEMIKAERDLAIEGSLKQMIRAEALQDKLDKAERGTIISYTENGETKWTPLGEQIRRLEAERDAAREKAIEECANEAYTSGADKIVVEAIRALKDGKK